VARLRVFVEEGCRNCDWALRLVQDVHERFPELDLEVVDVADPSSERPEDVFAVPTFMLDGRVLSLGNPRRSKLVSDVAAALEREKCGT
jgi:hypothetical protein